MNTLKCFIGPDWHLQVLTSVVPCHCHNGSFQDAYLFSSDADGISAWKERMQTGHFVFATKWLPAWNLRGLLASFTWTVKSLPSGCLLPAYLFSYVLRKWQDHNRVSQKSNTLSRLCSWLATSQGWPRGLVLRTGIQRECQSSVSGRNASSTSQLPNWSIGSHQIGNWNVFVPLYLYLWDEKIHLCHLLYKVWQINEILIQGLSYFPHGTR